MLLLQFRVVRLSVTPVTSCPYSRITVLMFVLSVTAVCRSGCVMSRDQAHLRRVRVPVVSGHCGLVVPLPHCICIPPYTQSVPTSWLQRPVARHVQRHERLGDGSAAHSTGAVPGTWARCTPHAFERHWDCGRHADAMVLVVLRPKECAVAAQHPCISFSLMPSLLSMGQGVASFAWVMGAIAGVATGWCAHHSFLIYSSPGYRLSQWPSSLGVVR